MVAVKYEGDLLPERRGIISAVFNSVRRTDRSLLVVRRGRSLRLHLPGNSEHLKKLHVVDNGESTHSSISISNEVNQEFSGSNNLTKAPTSKQRKRHSPCEVGFVDSVDYLREPQDIRNFTQFSLQYVVAEEKPLGANLFQPRFGGHQTLEERENSFFANNQTLHCGFVKAPTGFPNTGFDLDEKDKAYMSTCRVVVSSCIFGSSDFLRRPTSKRISEFSKRIVCFVMFVDEQTLSKLFSDGNIPDDRGGYVGPWRIIVVKNLPYQDMRRTGKVPKFLSHRLFPYSKYSMWLDSKMRLTTDPLLILEYFLWRT